MAVRGDAAQLVEAAGAGIACLPENAESIASAVEKLVNLTKEERAKMGKRGAAFYQQELSISVGTQHFERVFTKVCNSE